MALKIAADRVVTITYRITDTEGRVLDECTPAQPYEYIHGRGQIVAPVERLLEGKTVGFTGEVSVSPHDAYGDYDPSLVAELPRAHFPREIDLQIGMKFNTVGPDGRALTVRVTAIEGDMVTIDGNHPLAGINLIFELRVLDVREATSDELDSGRVAEIIVKKPGGYLGPGSGMLH